MQRTYELLDSRRALRRLPPQLRSTRIVVVQRARCLRAYALGRRAAIDALARPDLHFGNLRFGERARAERRGGRAGKCCTANRVASASMYVPVHCAKSRRLTSAALYPPRARHPALRSGTRRGALRLLERAAKPRTYIRIPGDVGFASSRGYANVSRRYRMWFASQVVADTPYSQTPRLASDTVHNFAARGWNTELRSTQGEDPELKPSVRRPCASMSHGHSIFNASLSRHRAALALANTLQRVLMVSGWPRQDAIWTDKSPASMPPSI